MFLLANGDFVFHFFLLIFASVSPKKECQRIFRNVSIYISFRTEKVEWNEQMLLLLFFFLFGWRFVYNE